MHKATITTIHRKFLTYSRFLNSRLKTRQITANRIPAIRSIIEPISTGSNCYGHELDSVPSGGSSIWKKRQLLQHVVKLSETQWQRMQLDLDVQNNCVYLAMWYLCFLGQEKKIRSLSQYKCLTIGNTVATFLIIIYFNAVNWT